MILNSLAPTLSRGPGRGAKRDGGGAGGRERGRLRVARSGSQEPGPETGRHAGGRRNGGLCWAGPAAPRPLPSAAQTFKNRLKNTLLFN